jgi:hypothetical protein
VFGNKAKEGAKILSVSVTTNGSAGVVSPGQKSRQDIDVWIYPANYSRRIEVRGFVEQENPPLRYRTKRGELAAKDTRTRDMPLLGARYGVKRAFNFDLEHTTDDENACTQVASEHLLKTQVRTAELIDLEIGPVTGWYTERDSKKSTLQCRSR